MGGAFQGSKGGAALLLRLAELFAVNFGILCQRASFVENAAFFN